MGHRTAAVLCIIAALGTACSTNGSSGSVNALGSSTVASVPVSAQSTSAAEPAAPGNATGREDTTGTPVATEPEADRVSTETSESGAESDAPAAAEAGGARVETAENSSTPGREGDDGESGADPVSLHTAIAAYPFTLWPSERGDSGDAVTALQDRLAEIGIGTGGSDGSYGGRTAAAVEAFQRLVELEPTGDAGPETVAALTDYRYEGLLVRKGDDGDDVKTLQELLSNGPFDPGPIDGAYGGATVQAVWALEKLAGMPTDGDWGPLDERAWQLLQAGEIGRPERDHDQRWVEVDLSKQLMKVYDPDSPTPTLISHASSGSGVPWENEEHSGSSITPTGDFHITRRIAGWRESSLNIGRLYNPLYFRGGIALHGASSVPLYPASHGCVRLPMHIADYLPAELPNGTPVHVLS